MWDRTCRFLFGDPGRVAATLVAIAAWHVLFHMLRRRGGGRPVPLGRLNDRDVDGPIDAPSDRPVRRNTPGDPHRRLVLAHQQGRHDEAAAIARDLLDGATGGPSREADIRRRLADAFDGLDRGDEAEEQRTLAEAALEGAPRDPAWAFHLGRLRAARRDFAGAVRASEEGLALAPPGRGPMRLLLTRCLATDLFMAGRMEESARRAEEMLDLAREPEEWISAHRQAAASYSSLGRLDEAEAHAQAVLELTEEWGEPREIAGRTGFLAGFRRKRGQLAGALDLLERAEAPCGPTRETEVVRAEVLRSMGRFDEALAAFDRADGLDPLAIPRFEWFQRGVHAFGRAHLLLLLGRLDEAEVELGAVRVGIGGDARIGLWCDAADVLVAALRGRREEAARGLDAAERRLEAFADDGSTRSVVLGTLGRAALVLGTFERAVALWRCYLDLPVPPVDEPTGHHHLSDAYRGLGDLAAARAHDEAAVAAAPETYYARLSRQRLEAKEGGRP